MTKRQTAETPFGREIRQVLTPEQARDPDFQSMARASQNCSAVIALLKHLGPPDAGLATLLIATTTLREQMPKETERGERLYELWSEHSAESRALAATLADDPTMPLGKGGSA